MCKDKRCLGAGAGVGVGAGGAHVTGGGSYGGVQESCQCPQCPSVTTLYPPIIHPRGKQGTKII